VVAEKLAISNYEGTVEFYSLPTLPGNSSTVAPGGRDPTIPVEMCTVPCKSLDQYFAGQDIQVDLLKVDVEGAEYAVLDGARRVIAQSPKLKLLLEWDPARWSGTTASPEDVRDILTSMGLAPNVIRSPSDLPEPIAWEQVMQIPYENILFTRP
jgi:hypothetical protein